MLLRLAKSLAPSLEERGTSPVGLENSTDAQLAGAPGHRERDAVVPHADRAGGHGQREDEGHEQKGVKRHAGNEETKRAAGQLGGSREGGREVGSVLPLVLLYSRRRGHCAGRRTVLARVAARRPDCDQVLAPGLSHCAAQCGVQLDSIRLPHAVCSSPEGMAACRTYH